jgi:catalase
VDRELARQVALGIGVPPPAGDDALTLANERLVQGWQQYGVTGLPGEEQPTPVERAPELSMAHGPRETVKSRLVALLAADGVDSDQLAAITAALAQAGAHPELVSPSAIVRLSDGTELPADRTLLTAPSVIYDGVFVPGGAQSVAALQEDADAVSFVGEAFKHSKTIGAAGAGVDLLLTAAPASRTPRDGEATLLRLAGIVGQRDGGSTREAAQAFIAALAQHRHFSREAALKASRDGAPRAPQNAAAQKPARVPRRRAG